eukprot:gene1863-3613_t
MAIEALKTALKTCLKSSYIQGQTISVLLAVNCVFASFLTENDSNFPELMSFVFYLSLSTYFFHRLYKSESISLTQPWYWYTIIAFFDVEGNFLMTTAYKYTSLTSIGLLDCFAIPCVVLLSHLFLNAKYKIRHFIGASISILGMLSVVLSDLYFSNKSNSPPNPLLGDCMVLVAATFFSCSNVLQEKLVKTGDRKIFLGLLGVDGAILTLIQALVLSAIGLYTYYSVRSLVALDLGIDPDTTTTTNEAIITSPMQINQDAENNHQVEFEVEVRNPLGSV